jgi:hypothetical protein
MARPTHVLVLRDKENKCMRTIAGAGWENEQGWINIRLNPGVCISEADTDRYWISLYPKRDDWTKDDQKKDEVDTGTEVDTPAFGDDDIPF